MTDNAAPANSIDDYPHKVFAGNLSFKTTEDELKEFFSPAGSVVKVNIITRGSRSLGYGFVAFSCVEECQAAVEKLHKQMLGGREINIEVAKPKEELDAAKKERRRRPITRTPKRYNKRRPAHKEEAKADEESEEAEKKEGTEKRSAPKKGRRPRKSQAKKEYIRSERTQPTGPPSKTTVFVANLPFSLTDETLRQVFADYEVKSAKVVCRRGTGRSKGFGFVELADENEQQKLLNAPVLVSEGRELNIKVALSEDKALAAAVEPQAELATEPQVEAATEA